MVKKAFVVLCASVLMLASGAVAASDPGTGSPPSAKPGSACSYLDAATISRITGMHITKVKDVGDSCVYVDPTAHLNPVIQQFSTALAIAFSGESPLRLKGSEGHQLQPWNGAGVVVRLPGDSGDLTQVSVHDYVQSILAEVPADARCGSVHDVKGLNAASVVCLNGSIGHGGVVKDGKAVQIMYLAPVQATNDVMGRLLAAAAMKM
jgi:hypothetical protein